jgi:nickel superoxide dismutase
MINELSKEAKPNYNQIVRWVVNKEEHAKKIQEIVSQYFLHQRVKITDSSDKEKYAKYINQLTTLHELSVYAMKAKQNTDLDYTEKLRSSLDAFGKVYFHSHEH